MRQCNGSRAQSSMEASMLITAMVLTMTVLLAVTSEKVAESQEKKDIKLMEDLASVIESEVKLALAAEEGYERRFELPPTLNGKPYSVEIKAAGTKHDGRIFESEHSEIILKFGGNYMPGYERIISLPKTLNGTEMCLGTNILINTQGSRNISCSCIYGYKDEDGDGYTTQEEQKFCGLEKLPITFRKGQSETPDCDDANAEWYMRYPDSDRDGHGGMGTARQCASRNDPAFSDTNDDCNDNREDQAARNSYRLKYRDRDGDGYGSGAAICAQENDPGFVDNNYDCDDSPTTGSGRWLKKETIGGAELDECAEEHDITPPTISGGSPTGRIRTPTAELSVTTNERASCKYDTQPNRNYDAMTNTFPIVGMQEHKAPLSGLTTGLKHYYIRCADPAGNKNTADYIVGFTVALPGDPIPDCTPSWACTDWSSCRRGLQTRTCTDSNSCETSAGKPEETRTCQSSDLFDYKQDFSTTQPSRGWSYKGYSLNDNSWYGASYISQSTWGGRGWGFTSTGNEWFTIRKDLTNPSQPTSAGIWWTASQDATYKIRGYAKKSSDGTSCRETSGTEYTLYHVPGGTSSWGTRQQLWKATATASDTSTHDFQTILKQIRTGESLVLYHHANGNSCSDESDVNVHIESCYPDDNECSAQQRNLLMHYRMDGDLTDSKYRADATAHAGVTCPASLQGIQATACQFDGTTNAYAEIPNGNGAFAGSFTINLHAKFDDTERAGTQWLIHKMNTQNGAGYAIYYNPSEGIVFTTSTVTGAVLAEPVLRAGEYKSPDRTRWYKITASYSEEEKKLRLYIDGVEKASSPDTPRPTDSGRNLGIGGIPGGSSGFFKGKMDEVKFYMGAYTPQQITP